MGILEALGLEGNMRTLGLLGACLVLVGCGETTPRTRRDPGSPSEPAIDRPTAVAAALRYATRIWNHPAEETMGGQLKDGRWIVVVQSPGAVEGQATVFLDRAGRPLGIYDADRWSWTMMEPEWVAVQYARRKFGGGVVPVSSTSAGPGQVDAIVRDEETGRRYRVRAADYRLESAEPID
jgi:hypothetical protein